MPRLDASAMTQPLGGSTHGDTIRYVAFYSPCLFVKTTTHHSGRPLSTNGATSGAGQAVQDRPSAFLDAASAQPSRVILLLPGCPPFRGWRTERGTSSRRHRDAAPSGQPDHHRRHLGDTSTLHPPALVRLAPWLLTTPLALVQLTRRPSRRRS